MSRLPIVDPTRFSPELAERAGHPSADQLVQLGALPVWANQPAVAVAFLAFQQALAEASSLPLRLRELVRLRIAFHNRCRSCMAVRSSAAMDDGLTEAAVCSLERPEEADDLTEAEKAAIHYADLLATDHFQVTDGTFDRLRRHFSEAEIVELCGHVGLCVGFGRVAMSWDIVDALPEAFLGDRDDVVPWTTEAVRR